MHFIKLTGVILLLASTSCTKNWVCTVETTSSQLSTSYQQIDFKGTHQEKNDFEMQGTKETPYTTLNTFDNTLIHDTLD